ncbi:hypothetical protein AAMO2058_001170700 [Amorphochlora amoebiformis]
MPKSSRRRRGARPRGPQINSKSQTFLTEPAKSNLSLHSTPLQPCSTCSLEKLPDRGCWRVGKTCIENRHQLEFNERLNASSYVNVVFEKEESEVAFLGSALLSAYVFNIRPESGLFVIFLELAWKKQSNPTLTLILVTFTPTLVVALTLPSHSTIFAHVQASSKPCRPKRIPQFVTHS